MNGFKLNLYYIFNRTIFSSIFSIGFTINLYVRIKVLKKRLKCDDNFIYVMIFDPCRDILVENQYSSFKKKTKTLGQFNAHT